MSNSEKPDEENTTKKEIFLPEGDYVLECWKVREGDYCQPGETIALACPRGSSKIIDTGNAGGRDHAPQLPKASHKRPSRRKINRPATAAAPPPLLATAPGFVVAASNERGEELSSIKLPPTVKERKDNSVSTDSSEAREDSKPEAKQEEPMSKQEPTSIPIQAPIGGILRIGNHTNGLSTNPKSIGVIEPCEHPAKVHGLCVVCGLPVLKKETEETEDGMPSEPSKQEGLQVTENGITIEVSKKEGFKMGKQNTERLRRMKKLSLVLDLDATLVHATGDPRAHQHLDRGDVRQIFVPGSEDGRGGHFRIPHYVKLRPNVKEFLEAVSGPYEIGVYTAGTREYAEAIAIILCRDLVGAHKDEIHLDQLRYQIAQAEKQLAAFKAAPRRESKNCDDEAQGGNSAKASTGDLNQKDPTTPEMEAPRKKRKVTFAVEPQDAKEEKSPDRQQITAENVLALEQELQEAEEKEKEALDLRQRIFGKRIVSRTDITDLGRDVKSLRRIFPCGGTMAAVVDDREEVWANAKDNIGHSSNMRRGEPPENLLLVEAYHWQPFKGFAEINNPSGMNLSTDSNLKSGDEGDEQLLWTKDILLRLHDRYYKQDPTKGSLKNVPEILSEMRREVLAGEKIALSGLVPLSPSHRQGEWNDIRRPRHGYVRYVETMGGTIVQTVQPGTTFVVAKNDNGSDKILAGWRTPGCLVVKRTWLMQCYWSLTRRDPKPHVLPPSDKAIAAGLVAPTSPKEAKTESTVVLSVNQDDDSDDDDDDFAADLEKDLM